MPLTKRLMRLGEMRNSRKRRKRRGRGCLKLLVMCCFMTWSLIFLKRARSLEPVRGMTRQGEPARTDSETMPAMYDAGSGPQIVGLERCEAFRRHSTDRRRPAVRRRRLAPLASQPRDVRSGCARVGRGSLQHGNELYDQFAAGELPASEGVSRTRTRLSSRRREIRVAIFHRERVAALCVDASYAALADDPGRAPRVGSFASRRTRTARRFSSRCPGASIIPSTGATVTRRVDRKTEMSPFSSHLQQLISPPVSLPSRLVFRTKSRSDSSMDQTLFFEAALEGLMRSLA